MKDSELRSTVLRHLDELDRSAQNIASARDALDDELKAFMRIQAKLRQLVQAGGDESVAEKDGVEPIIVMEPLSGYSPPEYGAEETAAVTEGGNLGPFAQELVYCYNEEPGKWRGFSPVVFGAENVNDIWDKGGEPKFAKKEGGIYNLVVDNGVCYVVPEPGLRLDEGYVKSEGLSYLFDISGYSLEKQPPVVLIRPATVEESNGRWTICQKGEIRGRL
jgi:hypothetical protein